MITLLVGFISFVGIILASLGADSIGFYFNLHSIIIVIGGTIAVLLFSNSPAILKTLYKALKGLFAQEGSVEAHSKELIELAQSRTLSSPSKDPLINYAVELWELGVAPEMFIVLLSQKREHLEAPTLEATHSLRNLSKYPPALGMTGTVMGMVTLFSNLNSEGKDKIGPALAVAMTATFFGLIMAHVFIMPLADRLHVAHLKQKAFYSSVYEILLLINRGEAQTLIADEVRHREAA